MKKDDKTNIDLDIMNLVNKLFETPGNTKDVVMYVRGDAEFQTTSLDIKGQPQLMAQTLHGLLDNNQEFRRFFLATLGSWIAKNPTEEKMFLNGVEMAKKTFSVN